MQISNQADMFFAAKRNTFQKAEFLRKNMTLADKSLWQRLNKNQLGYKFEPQHPIDIFIVEFYCQF